MLTKMKIENSLGNIINTNLESYFNSKLNLSSAKFMETSQNSISVEVTFSKLDVKTKSERKYY